MTLPDDTVAKARRLFFVEHWKVGTIAAQLGVHHDAVERAVGLCSPRRVVPLNPEPALLAPFAAFIDETLTQYPTLRATRLYDMLRERGYAGTARLVRRHVARVRPPPRRDVVTRVETMPGEQAQVDWALVGPRPVPGGTRDLWIFLMVLAHSRMLYVEFVWDLGAESLRRSLVRAHAFFGGSPRQWLFDNPRTVVLERHGGAVRFHPRLIELAGQLLCEPRLCNPRAPREKGKVERAVRYVRDRFLAGRAVRDVAHGNAEVATFLREIAPARRHPTQPDRTVAEVFDAERARLLALPDPMPSLESGEPVAVDVTASAPFDGNLYSVPAAWAQRTLTLVTDDATVRLLDGATEVARHARSWGRRQRIEDAAHRAAVTARRPAAQALKGRDRLRAEVAGVDALLARWVHDGRNLGSVVGRTVVLLDLYGAEALTAAVGEALARGTTDPGALSALCEQRRRAAQQPLPTRIELGTHVPDRDVRQHDLGGYDER